MNRALATVVAAFGAAILIARPAFSAEFKLNSEQYGRLLDLMQAQGPMTKYRKECKTDDRNIYVCTFRGDGFVIISYAPDEASNITSMTFAAGSKAVDQMASLAAVASLSLNQKFVHLKDNTKGTALMAKERQTIEEQMMSFVVRGGEPSIEEIAGGERFFYQIPPDIAAVRVTPKD